MLGWLFGNSSKHPDPNPTRYQTPEEDHESIAPIDGDYGTSSLQSPDDLPGHLVGFQLHGIVAAADQRCTDKAWADIVDTDVCQLSDMI